MVFSSESSFKNHQIETFYVRGFAVEELPNRRIKLTPVVGDEHPEVVLEAEDDDSFRKWINAFAAHDSHYQQCEVAQLYQKHDIIPEPCEKPTAEEPVRIESSEQVQHILDDVIPSETTAVSDKVILAKRSINKKTVSSKTEVSDNYISKDDDKSPFKRESTKTKRQVSGRIASLQKAFTEPQAQLTTHVNDASFPEILQHNFESSKVLNFLNTCLVDASDLATLTS
jgi:hypothetical protein